jgi:hypothetical protein
LTLTDGVVRVGDDVPPTRTDPVPGAGSGGRIRVVAADPGDYVVLARLARELRVVLHVR